LERAKENLVWAPTAAPELRPVAEQIWASAARGPVTVTNLFQRCTVCELKIYQVVDELLQSRHFVWSTDAANAKVA
jgi:hypothetical protein